MNKSTFIFTALLTLVSIVALALGNLYLDERHEKQQYQDFYAAAIAKGETPPIVVLDTIIDTASAGIVYLPVEVPGDLSNYVSKDLAEDMATALGVAKREIDRLNSKIIRIEAKGKGERSIDSVTKEEWLVLNDDPVFDVKVNLANDSIFPSARLIVDQAYAPYKKNIFSTTEYRSYVRARDPRVEITQVYDLHKPPKSSRWGISAYAGPITTPQQLTYGVGLGLTYDIIQF